MPAQLTEFENKVIEYLIRRKTAATIKQIAKFFIRSESYVSNTLKSLVSKGLVDVVMTGGTKLYVVKQ